jgi:hypothetical protein
MDRQEKQQVETDQAQRDAGDALQAVLDERTISVAITRLASGSAIYLPSVVRDLSHLMAKRPKDRCAAILLGRALRRQGKHDEAIGVLLRFLTAIEFDLDHVSQEDRCAAHYNIACYQAIASPPDIDGAFEHLKQSLAQVDANSDNADEARSDRDFAALVRHDRRRFVELVGAPTAELEKALSESPRPS